MTQRQCKKCPWLTTTDPYDIPHGYCPTRHRALANTIAKPASLENVYMPLRVMACHESRPGRERTCVGWLHNQLNEGNNIPLRLGVVQGTINADYELTGEQHATLEDTLPAED